MSVLNMGIAALLTPEQTAKYLDEIGMTVGAWNQLADASESRHKARKWLKVAAPKNSRELYVFSQHVAGWLPAGDWKLLQVDNSTALGPAETALLTVQLFDFCPQVDRLKGQAFLYELQGNRETSAYKELAICNLIFTLLLVEAHAQIVSSESQARRYLSVQDGYVYLIGDPSEKSAAEALVAKFEAAQLVSPSWVVDIVAANQNLMRGG